MTNKYALRVGFGPRRLGYSAGALCVRYAPGVRSLRGLDLERSTYLHAE